MENEATEEDEEKMKQRKTSSLSDKDEVNLEKFLEDSDTESKQPVEEDEKDITEEEKTCPSREMNSNPEAGTYKECIRLIRIGICCLLSYCVGMIGWSILWVLIGLTGLTIYFGNKKTKSEKAILAADILSRGEREALECRFSELPAWVQFPDVHRVEWLNKMLSITWPHISYFSDHFLRHSVEPMARESLEAYKLWDFKFQQIDFGKIPPRLTGVKVQGEPGASEIILDVDFEYNGDMDVSFSVLKISSSVSELQIQGKARILLKPIIEDIPFIGGVQIYFLKSPVIDFDLGGAASILDLPGLNSVIKQLLTETIEAYAVLPNKINILLSDKISPLELKMPQPVGLIIVEVVEAKGLPSNMDFLSAIDPYVIIRYGSFELKTSVKSGSNPVWNEKLYFPIEDLEFHDLNLTVFDRDVGSADDFSGSSKIDVASIFKNGKLDEWIPLENVPSGSIHLRLSWSQVRSDPVESDKSTLLCIFLDSISVGPRYASRPNLKVILKAGENARETQNLFQGEKNPKFHEGFVFFIENYEDGESKIKFTIFDSRGQVNVSTGSFLIQHIAAASRKSLQVATYKLNDNESTVSFAAQVHHLDKNINNKFAESVHALLSSGSRRLVRGLGHAKDVSGYARNVKSATGSAIKSLGNVSSIKTISSSLKLREDTHQNTEDLLKTHGNTESITESSSSSYLGIHRTIKTQMKALLRL